MRPFHVLILAGICLPGPALALALPDCAGAVEIAHARIVRVERNGALILNDGRAVMLEGIRLSGTDDGGPDAAALNAVRELAMAGPLTLTATPPKEDRYDRIRVQAFGTVWLQRELLTRGLARVQIAPDRNECAPDLYEAEQVARKAGRGLWASPGNAVRQSESLRAADANRFQLVEGRVTNVAVHDGRMFLDFSDDFHRGFSAIIAPEDRKAFRNLDPPIENLVGRRIRLRGMMTSFAGRPEIALSNPAQIELLN